MKYLAGIKKLTRFAKAQAMRLPVYDKSRIIGCARDCSHHIGLPRDCFDDITKLLGV